MNIDWPHFDPVAALIGGLLIGASAALFAALNGRVAGISGIVGGLLRPANGDLGWRLAFIAGLIAAPIIFTLLHKMPAPTIDASWPLLIAAGLLVGIGTRYGAGCTSGHGICGVSRLSPRSLLATALFVATGFATVFIVRHLLGD